MRITFVLPGYPWNPIGGFRVVYEYANHLAIRGHKVLIVHPRKLANWEIPLLSLSHWVRKQVGKVCNLLFRPTVRWQPINKQIKMLYVPEPKAEHILDGDAVLATAWQTAEYVNEYPPSKGLKFYLVMDFDSYFGPKERLESTWELPFKKITISHWLYEKVLAVAGNQDIINIPLGIDHNRFRLIKDIKNRPKQIAMMYSPAKYKSVEDGIRALEICKLKHPEIKVVMFGATKKPKIPAWITYKHNLSEEELVNLYNQSMIFVCSSLAEGFAFPPAEAMACGCAVVSTDCGGNRDYAKDKVNALLSLPRDPEELAKNLNKLLENEDLRIKLAKEGYRDIQKFSWDRSTDILERFIKEKINSKNRK